MEDLNNRDVILNQIIEKGNILIRKLEINLERNEIRRKLNICTNEMINHALETLEELKQNNYSISEEFRDKKLKELEISQTQLIELKNRDYELNEMINNGRIG